MTFDGIHVDHRALDGAALEMRRAVGDLGDRLARLDAELAPLRGDWAGRAQESYAAAKLAWDRAIAEMRALLDETQVAVQQSNSDYLAADRRGAAQFGG
jgi:early secretory antigenic target protein ESAT-6